MTDVIKASEPRDLIAAASAVLVFHPTESLVVICLRGTKHRIGLVARTDLATVTASEAATSLARQVSQHADTTVLVAYSENAAARRRAVAAVTDALAEAEAPVMDAWWVSATAYGSATCADPACCPVEGWPLIEVEDSLVRAETTLRGTALASTRAALLPAPATPADRRQAEAARLAWIAQHGPQAHTGDPVSDETRAHEALSVWTEPFIVGRDTEHDPDAYGRLAAVLSDVTWRDLVIAFVVTTGEACNLSDATSTAFDGMLTTPEGTDPLRPNAATLPAEVSLLLRTAVHTDGAPAAHAYATAAMLAWWSGDGATANLAADAAAEADPAVSLTNIVRLLLDSGRPPAWVTATD